MKDYQVINDPISSIQEGQSILLWVRAVNKRDGGRVVGKKYQLALIQKVENPTSNFDQNLAISVLNGEDERFSRFGRGVRYGFATADGAQVTEFFGVPAEALEKLTVSTGIPRNEWVKDVHFIELNYLNPELPHSETGEMTQLHVQITETTEQQGPGSTPKINPSTNQMILHQGQPIYTRAEITIGPARSVFLPADVAAAAPPVSQPDERLEEQFSEETAETEMVAG